MYLDDRSTSFWEEKNTFDGNTAENRGALFFGDYAAIIWHGVTLFGKNRPRNDGGAVASAVDVQARNISLDGPFRFFNNSCGRNGGAMALFGRIIYTIGDTALEFSGNAAALFGGAIYTSEAASGYTFFNMWFTENRAQVKM